jgi:uncharacterized repeat protein (TIGR03803 family)
MQHRRWIGGMNLRTTVAFVAVAILLIGVASHAAETQTITPLHGFNGMPDGAAPASGLTMDAAGNLYGTTQAGGVLGGGMVFKLVHTGSAWILHPLYSFPLAYGGGDDGAEPYAGVIIGPDGNLYGTTYAGSGSATYGTVFKLSPPASVCKSTLCTWTETMLYRFTGASDGGVPSGPVVFDSAGNLYGATYYGGVTCGPGYSCGVVFKLTRSGSSWTESVLHAFSGSPDGAGPGGALVFDHAGNLYGVTVGGGSMCAPDGCGTVFQLTPSGGGWTENVIHSFDYFDDGAGPQGGVIFDNEGDLFGTTAHGPNEGIGTVFQLTPSGGQWNYTLLYSLPFEGGTTGPLGTLAMDAAGNLYSMTFNGGDVYGVGPCEYGCGTVFKLSPSAGGWAYSLIYEFRGGTDGAGPYDGVILDRNGNLYGTASAAGARGDGVVFEITP